MEGAEAAAVWETHGARGGTSAGQGKRSGLVLNPSQRHNEHTAHTKQGGRREFKFYVPKVGKLWKERWGKQTGGITTAGHFRMVQEIRESGRICSVSLTGHRAHRVELKV